MNNLWKNCSQCGQESIWQKSPLTFLEGCHILLLLFGSFSLCLKEPISQKLAVALAAMGFWSVWVPKPVKRLFKSVADKAGRNSRSNSSFKFMLEKPNRLRGKRLFQEVFTRGKRVFVGGVGCFSLPLKDDTLVVGVTFTQKAFPKAVTRHRYKRLALHLIRKEMPLLPMGKALVFHFQRPLPVLSSPALRVIIHELLKRSH